MKIEMNDEWRAKWVTALRSGNYKQTQLSLKDSKGFCCLGVLCDISDLGYWKNHSNGATYACNDSANAELLPADVANTVGLVDTGTQKRLAELNDDSRLTFEEIAHIIERGEYAEEELGEDVSAATEPTLEKVWDNDEDAAYDDV